MFKPLNILFGFLFFTVMMLLGCQTNPAMQSKSYTPKKSDKLIEEHSGYRIYQRSDGSYYTYHKGRITHDHLKYVHSAALSGKKNMQALLNQHNEMITFYMEGFDAPYTYSICGNSMDYDLEISQRNGKFVLSYKLTSTAQELPELAKEMGKIHEFASFAKQGIDALYFKNYKTVINTASNDLNLYYRSGKKYGFYGSIVDTQTRKGVLLKLQRNRHGSYDKLSFVGDEILLQKGALVGYYKRTVIKYKWLGKFKGNLARFELPNAKYGYVSKWDKKEYYDK